MTPPPIPSDYRFINLTGIKFAQLTVVQYAGRRGASHYWTCICDCGTVKDMKGSHVKSGATKSCGCASRMEDITGKTFDRWLAVREIERDRRGNRMYLCQCECGVERAVKASELIHGRSKCCRCVGVQRRTKHNMCKSPEFRIWSHMLERCSSPKSSSYERYGGRGISVCEKWKGSFNSFYQDVGPRPSSDHSIERIDNNGNYEPGNCRWATRIEQARNKRNNRIITAFGQSLCIAEWAEKTGIGVGTISQRIRRGSMTPEQVVSESVRKN